MLNGTPQQWNMFIKLNDYRYLVKIYGEAQHL